MDSLTGNNKSSDAGASRIFWIVGALAAIAIAGVVVYFALQSPPPATQEAHLQNAIREGTPEFDNLKAKILVLEQRDLSTQTQNIAGGITLRLPGIVKNFSGKTLTGLEVVTTVLDDKERVIKEKTAIVIPTQVESIENNRSALVNVSVEGFTKKDDFSNFRFRVTGIKVE